MITLNPEAIDLATLRQLWQDEPSQLDDASIDRIRASAASVERIVASGETVYGVNTGFGLLANTRIPPERLAELQRNLILSHSCGLGDMLPRKVVRLMIVLKLLGLGRGYSGVRPLVINALQALLDKDAMPLIPAQGSVGASGDLAPLAHLIAALLGEGRIDVAGEVLPAKDGLKKLNMSPLELGPKEGLALINGTQASTAIALDALFMAERAFGAALGAGALSVDALKGSIKPFDPRISALRGQPGQIRVAAAIHGLLANTRIPDERLAELQTNLILSHSAGLGDPLPRHVTRLMIILKLLGLGRGYSGVRPVVIEALQALLDRDAMPVIPAQGSVGASGDLAPLAHLIAALMGEGRIDVAGEIHPAKYALAKLAIQPLELGPKEGLALINGTQASTAIALDALFIAERVFGAAIGAGAMSVDALKGSIKPFDPRISDVRGQPGQIRVAAEIRGLLEGSEILASHGRCGKVQDPYSFRCQPQVMGAALDLLANAARTLTIEAGAVTDNPIVFEDEDTAISGGNFHAQPVAFAADTIAMAMCEVGSLSERRTAVLIDPKMSGLPAFLTDDGGVNSGLMIPQVTQAALVAENRSLAFPASVDSVPTSAGQEDHVSMAPIAARKAVAIAKNVAGIVAVELIAAAQGVDYHAPLKTSAKLRLLHARVREISPRLESDRYWADEMAALQAAVLAGTVGPEFSF
jgi:histidine ammonia-lyase